MFGRHDIETAFRVGCPEALDTLSAQDGFDFVFAFFEGVRSSEALPDEDDGDMLLFQWGHPWQREDTFYVSMTRQLIFPDGDDQEIHQLSLQYDFTAADLPQVDRGNAWCHRRADLPAFRTLVAESDAMRAIAGHAQLSVGLEVSAV